MMMEPIQPFAWPVTTMAVPYPNVPIPPQYQQYHTFQPQVSSPTHFTFFDNSACCWFRKSKF